MFGKKLSKFKAKEIALLLAPLLVLLLTFGSFKIKLPLEIDLKGKPTPLPISYSIRTISFAPNGLAFATGSEVGVIKLWNTNDGALLWTFDSKVGPISQVVFSPNGHVLAATSGGSLFLWDMPSRRLIRVLKLPHRYADCIVFSPDSQSVVVSSGDGFVFKKVASVCLLQVKTGKIQTELKGKMASLASIAFSPDGKSLAVSGGMNKGTPTKIKPANFVRMWDLKTKRIRWEVSNGKGLAFSRDGQYLAVGADSPKLYDVQSGKLVSSMESAGFTLSQLIYSPDGKYLIGSEYGQKIRAWDHQSGQMSSIGFGSTLISVSTFALSADGKRLVGGNSSGQVQVVDVTEPNQAIPLAPSGYNFDPPLLMSIDTITDKITLPEKSVKRTWRERR